MGLTGAQRAWEPCTNSQRTQPRTCVRRTTPTASSSRASWAEPRSASTVCIPLSSPELDLTAAGGNIPIVLGAGAGFGVACAAFKYTNGLSGYATKEDNEDEVARKEELRKMRRRPLQETLEQLGEGRGTSYHVLDIMLAANINRYLRSRL